MSYNELLDWASFATMFPFEEHEQRLESQIALLCKLVVDLHYWFAGKKSQLAVEDFLMRSKDDIEVVAAPSDEPKKATISSDVVTGLFVLSSMSKDH